MSTEISNEQLIHKFTITWKMQYSLPIQPKTCPYTNPKPNTQFELVPPNGCLLSIADWSSHVITFYIMGNVE